MLSLLAAGCLLAQPGLAPTNAALPMPFARLTPSPVELFRMLLATNSSARDAFLAGKSPKSQAVIQSKLREYEAMTPAAREARLQASQLHWYLPPLMGMNAAERARHVAAIPQPDRKLIEERLGLLSIFPPPLQNEIITNQNLFRLVETAEQSGGKNPLGDLTGEQRNKLEQQYQVWIKLVALPPDDRNKALSPLNEADRARMELTLSHLGGLSGEEREQAVQGFRKFAELSPADRITFLKTAERWRTMSAKDRQLWRSIVASMQRARTAPPLPMPQVNRPQPESSSLLATNGY